MDDLWKDVIWQQLGAAIDTLENALLACPEELWSDRSRRPEVWYLVYHTLFFLRQTTDSAPGWVAGTKSKLGGE